MSLVKQWMTDILLEITNQEMTKVAKEVFQYEKGKRRCCYFLLFHFLNVCLKRNNYIFEHLIHYFYQLKN